MAETLTTRFGLPQWSVGDDAPSRVEFNAAFANIEARAAYDDGASASAVPTTNLVPGRYARVANTDGSFTLYRRSATVWEYVGGPVAPVASRVVALSGQAATDQAFSIEQTIGGATLYGTYQGDWYASGVLRSANMVAAAPLSDTITPSTTGRAYVKTQGVGELGLVVRAHASTAGNLFTAREQGGSDVVTVDALGRLRATVPAAFGGASLSTSSVLAVAPTSGGSDGITNGLLITGNASAPGRSLLTALAAPADTSALAYWQTNAMSFGKLPWGSSGSSDGQMTLAADVMNFRAVGANLPGGTQYGQWFQFRTANPAAQSDTSQDVLAFSLGKLASEIRLPLYVSQETNPTITNLTAYRFTDFTAGRFMELIQATRVNPTTLSFQTASDWCADGRLRTGVLWKGTSAMRDARQSIRHVSIKTYAASGSLPTDGQSIAPSGSFSYTFPVMTLRSFGGSDLEIALMMELLLGNTGSSESGQLYGVDCFIAVNGGSFNQITPRQENAQAASPTGGRPVGDLMHSKFRIGSIPNSATFQIKFTVSTSSAAPTFYLRKLDLAVDEVTFESYVAA